MCVMLVPLRSLLLRSCWNNTTILQLLDAVHTNTGIVAVPVSSTPKEDGKVTTLKIVVVLTYVWTYRQTVLVVRQTMTSFIAEGRKDRARRGVISHLLISHFLPKDEH